MSGDGVRRMGPGAGSPGRPGRRGRRVWWRPVVVVLALLAAGGSVSSCGTVEATMPACGSYQRLALVAQSVPGASYVPCLAPLPAGWRTTGFRAERGSTRFSLVFDRSPDHPVAVTFSGGCDPAGATPVTARAAGARTLARLRSISPRYAGTLIDVFSGGCVTYAFDFLRGPHIGLMADFESAVSLYPRQELAAQLHRLLGTGLGS